MFTEIGESIDDLIDSIFIWNRRRKWYKQYCYYIAIVKRYDIERIIHLYRGGYISENHFIKLAKKQKCNSEVIRSNIRKHKEIIKTINEFKNNPNNSF